MNLQITLALRYLGGRKLRTFLTTLAIVFGVLVVFGGNTILPTFLASFQANAMAMAGQVDITITNKTGEAFSTAVVEKLAAVDGVRAVSGTLERSLSLPADYFDADPGAIDRISAVTLVGADIEAIRSLISYPVQAGRFLEAGDTLVTVITESFAEEAGVVLGDTLTLPTATGLVDLTIVGILPQRLMPGNEEVLVTLAQAQKLMDMPGKINVLEANFDSVEESRRAETQARIENALGSTYTFGALQAGAEILNNIQIGQMIFNLLGIMCLLMGGFIIFNTFRTVVAERRHDIGMLRAVGANRRTVTSLILVEGIIQGVLGTAAGLLLGYVFGLVVLNAVAPIMRQFLNINVGTPSISPGLVLGSMVLGVGITVLAGLLPARAASRVSPLEALRPSVGEISLRRMSGLGFWVGIGLVGLALAGLVSGQSSLIALGSVLFIVGLILASPALIHPISRLFGRLLALTMARDGSAQLAEGNLSRQPGRAAVTASTTLIALAILVMISSLLSSVSIGFIDMLKKSLSSDYLVLPPSLALWGMNVGASPDLAEEFAAVDGVSVVSSLRFASSKVNEVSVGLLGIEPESYTQTSGLTFSEGDPATAFKELVTGRNMIINGVFGVSIGAKLGDEVILITPTGEMTYKIVGIAIDYLNAKTTTAYLSHANIAADFDRTEDVFYQINANEGADLAAVETALKKVLKPYPQFKLVSGQEFVEQNKGQFDAAFAGLYAMMVFLAVPSLIAMVNTLAIGIIERTREIGMLRAVGATRRHIRTIILAEALLLAAIGTGFGMLTGLYLGYMATNALATLGYPVVYIFPAQGVIAGIAIGLLFGALAAIIPARQAARLEIVQALRYE